MKKTFRVSGFDWVVKLAIDTSVITPEIAAEMVDYWGNSHDVLALSEGCPYHATARRAACELAPLLIGGMDGPNAVAYITTGDGWMPQRPQWLEVVYVDLPDFHVESDRVSSEEHDPI